MRSSLSNPASPSTLNFQGVTVSLILAERDPKLLNPCEAGEVGFGDVDLSLAGALSFVASDVAQPPRAARQARTITSLRFSSRGHARQRRGTRGSSPVSASVTVSRMWTWPGKIEIDVCAAVRCTRLRGRTMCWGGCYTPIGEALIRCYRRPVG